MASKKGPMLKPLVWNKVPKNRLKGTVWQEIKESSRQMSIDTEAFQVRAALHSEAA